MQAQEVPPGMQEELSRRQDWYTIATFYVYVISIIVPNIYILVHLSKKIK